MDKKISLNDWAKKVGVHYSRARQWEDEGRINVEIVAGKWRVIDPDTPRPKKRKPWEIKSKEKA